MRNYETITLSLLPKLKKKLDKIAKNLGISRSVLIRKAILDFINSKPTKADFTKEF